MTKVFGNRADFAIEAGVEPEGHTAAIVWGPMCVWCNGVPLGDLADRHCALYPSYTSFAWLADNLGSLWANELTGFDDIAAWNFLDGLLYGYHGDTELADARSLDECSRDAERWWRFDFLTNWGEQFDGYKSFLLCPPGDSVRVLSRRLPASMGRGVSVSQRSFVEAASCFVGWFESESLRIGVPCQSDV